MFVHYTPSLDQHDGQSRREAKIDHTAFRTERYTLTPTIIFVVTLVDNDINMVPFYSVAASSMVGYTLGLGDRHVQNILIDKRTSEFIHIDFGM